MLQVGHTTRCVSGSRADSVAKWNYLTHCVRNYLSNVFFQTYIYSIYVCVCINMEESRDSLKTNLLEEDNPKAAGAQCHSHTNHPLNTHLQDIQQFDEKLCAANHIGHSKCAHTPPKERHILSSPAAKKLITASVICVCRFFKMHA